MSNLRPKGEMIVLDGEERRLLFTLNVVDEVQDHFDCAIEEAVNKLTDKRESLKTLRYILMALLDDEADRAKRDGRELKRYTEQEAGWLVSQENVTEVLVTILKAYGLSLPEPDEFDSPNAGGRRSG